MEFDPALVRFYNQFFPDKNVPIDSPQVMYKIIEELAKMKRGKTDGKNE